MASNRVIADSEDDDDALSPLPSEGNLTVDHADHAAAVQDGPIQVTEATAAASMDRNHLQTPLYLGTGSTGECKLIVHGQLKSRS